MSNFKKFAIPRLSTAALFWGMLPSLGVAPIVQAAELVPTPIAATAEAQQALLASSNPVLAANKRVVYDMYREVLQGGRVDRIPLYFGEVYFQHNPNVPFGTEALANFVKGSRPVREVQPTITLPIVTMVAEGDFVMVNFVRPEMDADGKPYTTTWFDLYRLKDGKIIEHWDPALKSSAALKFDPNTKKLPQ
jgi:predicted SnoaL-like aldol condensation-catalyzing enzyme